METNDNGHVVLMKFNKCPKAFLQALMTSPDLVPWQVALAVRGLDGILPSRAKVFVHPEHYEAVMEAIRRSGLRFHADHVIVEPELEGLVTQVVRKIAKPKKGHRRILPLLAEGIFRKVSLRNS